MTIFKHKTLLMFFAAALLLGDVGRFSLFGASDTPLAEDKPMPETREDVYRKLDLLAEVMTLVRQYYVEEKEQQEIINGAIHGMLQTLDPYSDYLEAKAFKSIKDDTRGAFGGIGIHIGMRSGILTVIAPMEDTPGYKAGLLAGDRIVEIDGVKTLGMKLNEAVEKIRGLKGSKVRLTLIRENTDDFIELEIERDDIDIPSVKGTKMLRDGIGYIRIIQFAEPTADLVQEALDSLLTNKLDGLVLDLRNNPGGLVISAVQVAEKFLPKGSLIVTTRGRVTGSKERTNKASGNIHLLDFPMAVLVNRGSASAAEILAGALQDNRRAVLVGETTFGKGSVQSIMDSAVEPGTAIRLTTARYFTPSGRQIHDNGIEPDISLYVTPQEWAKVLLGRAKTENDKLFTEEEKKKIEDTADRQLERAVDILHALKVVNARL